MKVAIKKLTQSDLSLFRSHFDPHGSKQKAINLNAAVFVEQFYPGLRDQRRQIHFDLIILGPGRRVPLRLSRKVVRTASAKNWRLNGELINNPVEEDDRFDCLAPDDFAVLGFDGAVEPSGLRLLLIAKSADPVLHSVIESQLELDGRSTMQALNGEALRKLIEGSQPASDDAPHPLAPFLPEESVLGALFGDQSQQMVAATDGLGPSLDSKELQEQLETARQTGERGEELFSQLLEQEAWEGRWVSQVHARAAYDFVVAGTKWSGPGDCYVDVKSSRDATGSHFYVSLAELRWASNNNYAIARVIGVDAELVKVIILRGLSEVAVEVLDVLTGLPAGIEAQTFRIRADKLKTVAAYTLDTAQFGSEE